MKVNVFCREKCVGQAMVLQEGLYLCVDFSFSCQEKKLLRLKAFANDRALDLGILLYHNGSYHLHTVFPRKKLGSEPEYMVVEAAETQESQKIPVAADKPFPALDRLDSARLIIETGDQMYICLE